MKTYTSIIHVCGDAGVNKSTELSVVGDLACNLGMCPAWESIQRPFGSQASAQSTEPQQPGCELRVVK